MINKYEAVGIFLSIAVMAISLAILRFDAPLDTLFKNDDVIVPGEIIVVTTDEPGIDEAALADAIIDAASVDGELEKLIIDDIIVGQGVKEVVVGDTLTAHYIGRTQEGVQFDSSYLRGEPFTFTVGAGKVIPGWEQGLLGMRVGGQRILVIPSRLAYGDAQIGPIAAGATLVFAIELIEIN